LPPLAEQRRIVAAIEEHLSDLDAAVAALERVRANLERYRAAILNAALAAARQDSSTEERTLSQLSWNSGYGTSQKCSYDATGPAVLRIPNIVNGTVELDDMKFATGRSGFDESDAVAPGDLLIVRTNGSRDLIGRGALLLEALEEHHYFASYLIRYRLSGDSWLWRWIKLVWHAPDVRARLEAMAASSAGQYNLSVGKLDQLSLPIPPQWLAEQLTAEAEHQLAASARTGQDTKVLLRRSPKLRQSILHRAFEGKLVPQDPADEPASVLLDRIAAERATVPTPARRASRQSRRATGGGRA
jgi:type I restriction enzyme, S subunit